MDVLTVNKSNKNYRLLYDAKGRFQLVPINASEAEFKLMKVCRITCAEQGIVTGHTHDGHNLRFLDNKILTNDTVKFNLKTNEVVDSIKFEVNAIA